MGFLTRSQVVGVTAKDTEYEDYIRTHISNVTRAFEKYGQAMCRLLGADCNFVQMKILSHDATKMSCLEFTAYRIKFYPNPGESISQKDFDRAWLHHINNNDHHPEHWIIPTASGNTIVDMPVECIVEMLCDWQSFSYAGKGNAYDFYYKVDRKEGLLSDITRKHVEMCLELFKED